MGTGADFHSTTVQNETLAEAHANSNLEDQLPIMSSEVSDEVDKKDKVVEGLLSSWAGALADWKEKSLADIAAAATKLAEIDKSMIDAAADSEQHFNDFRYAMLSQMLPTQPCNPCKRAP